MEDVAKQWGCFFVCCLIISFSLFQFTLTCWDCFAVSRIRLVPGICFNDDDDDVLVVEEEEVLLLLAVAVEGSSVDAVKGDIMTGLSGTRLVSTEDGTLVTSQ
jgi:hypothetical protein